MVGAAGPGQRAALAAGGGLRVRVTRIPAAAVVMWREGGAAAVHRVHGLRGQRAEVTCEGTQIV